MDDCDGSVLFETDYGVLVIDVRSKYAPSATLSFIRLCEVGYYTNTLVYNVEKDFVAYGGDIAGTGRDGVSFIDLASRAGVTLPAPELALLSSIDSLPERDEAAWHGNVLCCLRGPVTSTIAPSQFFITLSEANTSRYAHLKGKHAVIGRVVKDSSEALKALSTTFVDDRGRPLKDVRIRRTVVLVYPPTCTPLSKEQLEAFAKHVPDPNVDIPKEEWDTIQERPSLFAASDIHEDERAANARREKLLAQSRAVELEILGDLTSAEAKPQDTVLFVCKLNPITTSENLNLIFSRFGEVTDCEVKRDPETKESLGYAFISFAKKEECEEAYRKMQDVVIDGRRVRVDFSQSEGKRARLAVGVDKKQASSTNRPKAKQSREDRSEKRRRRSKSPPPSARSRDRSPPRSHQRQSRSDAGRHRSDSDDSRDRKKKHKKHRHRHRSRSRERR